MSLCAWINFCIACISYAGWSDVSAYLSVLTLPDPVQFPMETWEWTIGRDYRDRIAGKKYTLLIVTALKNLVHYYT